MSPRSPPLQLSAAVSVGPNNRARSRTQPAAATTNNFRTAFTFQRSRIMASYTFNSPHAKRLEVHESHVRVSATIKRPDSSNCVILGGRALIPVTQSISVMSTELAWRMSCDVIQGRFQVNLPKGHERGHFGKWVSLLIK